MTTRIKLRRDTASNWMDINPVLALAEPGVETDTNKMKIGDGTTAWNKLQYADGADVTRIEAGFITSVGNIPETTSAEGNDFWFESVAVDSDLNSYYVGGNYNDDAPWAVKLDPMGDIVWQTTLSQFDAYAGEGQSVQIDPTNGQVVIIADMWNNNVGSGGDAGMMLYRLSPTDGTLIGNPTRLRDDDSANSVDIYPYDIAMDGNKAVIFGSRNDDMFNQEVSKVSGSGNKIVILSNILDPGSYPRSYYDWYMTGTDINNEGPVMDVNDYSDVDGTAQNGSSGNGASFNFTFYVRAGETIKDVGIGGNSGSGYGVNDIITILAADIGATTDAHITVTQIGGSGEVTDFTCTDYAPDLSKVMLTIDSQGGGVDFNGSGTWNLIQYKGDSAFVYSEQGSGWTKISDGADDDWYNCGAIDSQGNVYGVGGRYDPDWNGGFDRGVVNKYSNTGTLLYSKSFDFAGSEGADTYTGVAIDSNDNVYIAGTLNDWDNTGADMQVITKVNSAGVMQWQKRFSENEDPYNMWNMCLAVDSDDNIYMAAEYNSPDSIDDDFFFAKFDSSGNVLWQRMLSSYGDASTEWSNGFQSLKVQGDKLFFAASTRTYSNNDNDAALAFSINTDGTGVGTIANALWSWNEVSLNWGDTTGQLTEDLQTGNSDAVFTTDEPTTNSSSTEYNSKILTVYDGMGGNVNGVRTITFEDGTVQTTAATNTSIPQATEGTLNSSDSSLTFRLDHAGKFIRCSLTYGSMDLYLPNNDDVPFEIGTVITIIADDVNNNGNRIYLYSDNGYRNPTITGVGYQSSNPPDWWVLNNNGNSSKTGIYTIMKVDVDRWVLAGPDLEENWC